MDALIKKTKLNKLKGKSNYTTWVPATMMELRKEKVAKMITETPPSNPDDIEEKDIAEKIKEWLAETEEVPDSGFTTNKVNGNKAKWKKAAKKDYDDWSIKNDVALEIIYNNCESQCQALIKEDLSAKVAWERLEKAYSQTGFASVVEQTTAMRSLFLNRAEGESIDNYTNKWKEVKSTLDSHGLVLPDDIWSGLYLAGLDDSFQALTRDLMNKEIKSFTFEQTIQSAYNEKLAIIATSRKENNNHGQGNAYRIQNNIKNDDREYCKRCNRHHGPVCWKEHPEKAPDWYQAKGADRGSANTVAAIDENAIAERIRKAMKEEARAAIATTPASLFGNGQGYIN